MHYSPITISLVMLYFFVAVHTFQRCTNQPFGMRTFGKLAKAVCTQRIGLRIIELAIAASAFSTFYFAADEMKRADPVEVAKKIGLEIAEPHRQIINLATEAVK